jgi:hypothetical protein
LLPLTGPQEQKYSPGKYHLSIAAREQKNARQRRIFFRWSGIAAVDHARQ